MSATDPTHWTPPHWDPSFGDPRPDLELLRTCALQVLRSARGSEVELCHVEDGYMYVAVRTVSDAETHIYVVERGKDEPGKWFGVFRNVDTNDETENYARTPEEVVALLMGN